ncbi:MAG: hypothetical protein HONBIEJF_02774 [Fimbriimonadaceae bacterium]|nr:hypothetical protein [Fimbriimonadaceae bacterium]
MRSFALGSVLVGSAFSLVGCASTAEVLGIPVRGKIQLSIEWPQSSRSLPSYSESVVATLRPLYRHDETQVINRPGGGGLARIFFTDLKREDEYDDHEFQEYRVDVGAYAGPDGHGELLAYTTFYVRFDSFRYTRDLLVAPNLNLNMSRLTIEAPRHLETGDRVQLDGFALDRVGRTLLLPVSALRWELVSGDATLTSDGLLTANSAGAVRVRLHEADGIVPPVDEVLEVENPPN